MLTPDLYQLLNLHGQAHLLQGFTSLSADTQAEFARTLSQINFAELNELCARKDTQNEVLPSRERISPLPVLSVEQAAAARVHGEAALRQGEVAVLLVAGGQGSRLGFDKPKGMYPVGPVSGASLFQIHAQKVIALSRRYGKPVPFLIMTSPATHADTEAYFADMNFFDLPREHVFFFQQGSMPAVDITTGKLLLEAPGKLFLSPNGHGGTLTALADSGLLAELDNRGIRHVFYFQVDNPLVNIADTAFVGKHAEARAEVSSKVVFKEVPEEKVGVLAQIDGRCGIIEYSDMPKEMTHERTPDGKLAFRAGNPAIHVFDLAFLKRVTTGTERLGYHIARKKVPHYDPSTNTMVSPTIENALKFELFIFDALPLADRWLAVETSRAEEFAPLKNATGNDSLATCQQLQVERARRWLLSVGAEVDPDAVPEISPLFALDAEELQAKLPSNTRVAGKQYFQG